MSESNWGTGERRASRTKEYPSVQEWRELAARGLTARQAADIRGVSVSAAHKAKRKHDLTFAATPAPLRKGIATRPLSERYKDLAELLETNMTLKEIGRSLGVTTTAVVHAMRTRKLSRPANWRTLRGITKRGRNDTRR